MVSEVWSRVPGIETGPGPKGMETWTDAPRDTECGGTEVSRMVADEGLESEIEPFEVLSPVLVLLVLLVSLVLLVLLALEVWDDLLVFDPDEGTGVGPFEVVALDVEPLEVAALLVLAPTDVTGTAETLPGVSTTGTAEAFPTGSSETAILDVFDVLAFAVVVSLGILAFEVLAFAVLPFKSGADAGSRFTSFPRFWPGT